MPTCERCGITQATVEMRRKPKSGGMEWFCKDRDECKQRRAAARAQQIALTKGVKKGDVYPEIDG